MKKWFSSIIFIALVVVHRAEASHGPALPLTMSLDSSLTAGGEISAMAVTQTVQMALQLVQRLPPPGNHFFDWSASRDQLQGKTIFIQLTTSDSPFVKTVLASDGHHSPLAPQSFSADSFTVAMGFKDQPLVVAVGLLIDKLLFEKTPQGFRERKDGLIRTAVALAHEFYGSVPYILELPFDNGFLTPPQDPHLLEITSATAGIAYIDRYISSPSFNSRDPEVKAMFISAKERAEKSLQDHLLAVCQDEMARPFGVN